MMEAPRLAVAPRVEPRGLPLATESSRNFFR
jgi:hypothetical protein